MLKRLAAATVVAAGLALPAVAVAAPANAATGQVCYGVQVSANGSSVVSQAGCQPIG